MVSRRHGFATDERDRMPKRRKGTDEAIEHEGSVARACLGLTWDAAVSRESVRRVGSFAVLVDVAVDRVGVDAFGSGDAFGQELEGSGRAEEGGDRAR